MDKTELAIHRANTADFIGQRPTSLTLTPYERQRTDGGGFKFVQLPPRPPQTFRIIELGMKSAPQILQLTDGQQRVVVFWLLGAHDAAVERDDFWTARDGREWRVGDVIRSNGYETRAVVVERGK